MSRYEAVHTNPQGPGDARPTAEQVIQDEDLIDKLKHKTILITGGTAGLGTESARVLHMTGAKIFITARNMAKGRQVAENISQAHPEFPPVEVVEMELSSLDSVRAAAADFLKRSDRLNVLMTNAGVMACPEERTGDGFELQFQSNHLSHFLLFQLLKPLMISSSTADFQSRVISLSSSGHRISNIHPGNYNLEGEYQPFIAYGQSKTANILMADEIERQYRDRGLHGLSVHPGTIFETEISRHQEGGRDGLHGRLTENDERLLKNIKSTAQGAATQVWAAVSKDLEGRGGLYLDDLQVGRECAEPDGVGVSGWVPWIWDKEMAARLWSDSNKMVGLPVGE